MKDTRTEIAKLQTELEQKSGSLLLLILLITVAVSLWIEIPLRVLDYFGIDRSTLSVGEAGDIFGSVNALFAGLAFVCLIWTIRQTNIEMRLQQRVAMLQVIELESSSQAMEEQAASQYKMTNTQLGLAKAQAKMASETEKLMNAVQEMSNQSRSFASQIYGHSNSLNNRLGEMIESEMISAYTNAHGSLIGVLWNRYEFEQKNCTNDVYQATRKEIDQYVERLQNFIRNYERLHGGESTES